MSHLRGDQEIGIEEAVIVVIGNNMMTSIGTKLTIKREIFLEKI